MTAPVTTTAQVDGAYRVAQATVSTVAAAQTLLAFRHLLDPRALDKTFPVYAGVAGVILNGARNKAATLAGAYYSAHRLAAGAVGDVPEIVEAGALDPAQVTTSLLVTGPVTIRQALGRGATLQEAVAAAERRTSGAAYRHAANGGRQTIINTAAADPQALGWARVTDGDPCFFCAMLASRGPVYKTERSATTAHDATRYHDHCGCYAAPVYDDDAPWPGDGRKYQKLWAESTRGLGGQRAINAFRQALEGKATADRAPVAPVVVKPPLDPQAEAFARWRVGRDVKVEKTSQVTNLPAFDPANPLAAYGDRITLHDESAQVFRHMDELEQFFPLGVHRMLRDHFAEKPGAGFYLGDAPVPELDSLGHLRGVQPRGWPAGMTWDGVDGAYNPGTRVCACGGKVNGAGHAGKHSSTALHEGAHAFDNAVATQTADGYVSDSADFRAAWDDVLTAHGKDLNVAGYFTPAGNPTGYYSEAFAEAFAEWARQRVTLAGRPAAIAGAVGLALTTRRTGQDFSEYVVNATALGAKVVAYFDALARKMGLDK